MSVGFDQRAGAGATTSDLGTASAPATPGKSTLTAGALPRTTSDVPHAGAAVQRQGAPGDTSAADSPPAGAAAWPEATAPPPSMTALAEAESADSTTEAAATEPAAGNAPAIGASTASGTDGTAPEDATRAPAPRPASSVPIPGIVRMTARDGLRVRRTPDAKARDNVMGGLAFHEELEAHARVGDWVAVTYRMQTAYVHGAYVEAAPHADAPANAPAADQGAGGSVDHTAAVGPAAPAAATTSSPPSSSHSAPSASGAAPAPPVPTVATPHAPAQPEQRTAGAGEFTTLSGNAIAKTTAKEAAVLNSLRADPRRFNPAWLVTAQRAIGVVDATGAMNTETMRALRSRAGKPSLDAAGILGKSFLVGIVPGEPFMATELGFAEQAPDGSARRPADLAAQAVGYASYAAYQAEWVPITFLGRSLGNPKAGSSGRGHPYLAARVHAAEAFLRQRHPGLGDEGVIKAIGWNGQGNAAYADQPETKASHQHTMGLAIDIDPAHNPYVFDEHPTGLTHDQAMWWIETFEQMFGIASRIYGGDPIDPKNLMDWSKTSSSEELIQRVSATSNALAKYLELSKKPKEEILATLAKAGYSTDEANAELPNVQQALERFQKGGGRQHATALTNIREELLIALRDVAGLSWGGAEMSPLENGDFMHFDCRDTSFGHAVYSKKAPTKQA